MYQLRDIECVHASTVQKVKATSFLFLSEMIEKLERIRLQNYFTKPGPHIKHTHGWGNLQKRRNVDDSVNKASAGRVVY